MSKDSVPTMVFAEIGKDGGSVDPATDYCYKVIGSEEVKGYLKAGWYESPAKIPAKKADKKK